MKPLLADLMTADGINSLDLTDDEILDSDAPAQMALKYAVLILMQANREKAKEIRLEEVETPADPDLHNLSDIADGRESPAFVTMLQLKCRIEDEWEEFTPPPLRMWTAIRNILCHRASVPYYANGDAEGRIITRNPDSTWLLSSDDLEKRIKLTRQ